MANAEVVSNGHRLMLPQGTPRHRVCDCERSRSLAVWICALWRLWCRRRFIFAHLGGAVNAPTETWLIFVGPKMYAKKRCRQHHERHRAPNHLTLVVGRCQYPKARAPTDSVPLRTLWERESMAVRGDFVILALVTGKRQDKNCLILPADALSSRQNVLGV